MIARFGGRDLSRFERRRKRHDQGVRYKCLVFSQVDIRIDQQLWFAPIKRNHSEPALQRYRNSAFSLLQEIRELQDQIGFVIIFDNW